MIAAQVVVAHLNAHIHRSCIDRDLDGIVLGVGRVNWAEPLSLVNVPRTVEIPMCRTANCADECAGSNCHALVWATAGMLIVIAIIARRIRFKLAPCLSPLGIDGRSLVAQRYLRLCNNLYWPQKTGRYQRGISLVERR